MNESTQQTNFQAHQRQARNNSRRLTIAFLFGILLSTCAYYAVTLALANFSNTITGEYHYSQETMTQEELQASEERENESKTIARMVTGGFTLVIIFGFLFKQSQLRRQTGEDIAVQLGACKLPPQLNLSQRQYINVVEEMAIASGIECPSIHYLPHDNTINAFVAGGHDDSVTITVSQGALDYLTRDELQALVAHEFGHIVNRDVFLNNRLTAILYGFTMIFTLLSFGRHGFYFKTNNSYGDEYSNNSNFFSANDNDNDDNGAGLIIIIIWWLSMMAISLIAIGIGKIIQAAYSRQREWLADAHAVQYTRNKDALVGVLSKALASKHLSKAPKIPADSAHFLFINYEINIMATHPSLERRIARYDNTVTTRDLNILSRQMEQEKQKKLQVNSPENNSKEKIQTLLGQSGMMLGATENSDVNAAQAQQLATASQFLPLIMLRKHQSNLIQHPVETPNDAVFAVFAQFILLSHKPIGEFAKVFKWKQSLQDSVQQQIDQLNDQHASTHIQSFLHQLVKFNEHKKKQAILKQIHYIIKADKAFELCEMSYLLCLRQAIQEKPNDSERQEDLNHYTDDIALLLTVAAHISHSDLNGRNSNFELMKRQAIPSLQIVYAEPILNNDVIEKLYKSIQRLASLKSLYRKNLLRAIEKNMLLDQQLSTEQNHLLFALKQILS